MTYGYELTRMATPGEAHAEWHLNAGVPMGTPGCPQDACHPVDEYDEAPEALCGLCGTRHAVTAIRAEYANHYANKGN